jgi:hypothetical protein
MSAANVVNRLIRTAVDIGAPGQDDVFGFGLVNPVAALTADVPTVETNPLDNVPPPGKARFGKAGAPALEESAVPEAPREETPVAAVGQAAVTSRRPTLAILPAGVALVLVLVGGATATLRKLNSRSE